MRGIKIPQQYFALKMQGGLCARGGVFAGHYGTYLVSSPPYFRYKQQKPRNKA